MTLAEGAAQIAVAKLNMIDRLNSTYMTRDMGLRRKSSIALLSASLALTAALVGCGSGSDFETQAFLETLRGLKRAAASNGGYEAVRRAKEDLKGVERETLEQFCNNVFQIRVNHEVHLAHSNRAYVIERLTRYIVYYSKSETYAARTAATLDRLETVINLGSLNNAKLERYLKACYH